MKSIAAVISLVLLSLMQGTAWAQNMSAAVASACNANQCIVSDLRREVVAGNIAHYSAVLKVGPGAHEVIGIHRVVREKSPWQPRATPRSLFMVHGDSLNFKAAFLIGPQNGTAASSIAGFLAAANIDVWGIDLRWAKVPEGTADFSFMAGWNLDTDVRDARIALLVARTVRALTGSGAGKLKYLGFSRGGQIGYVLTGLESQQLSALRSVDGLVVLDVPLKTNNPVFQATVCAITAQIQAQIAAGIYADPTGTTIRAAGNLAATDPSGASPILPGLTNYQAVLLFGGATHTFLTYVPHYHLIGSELGPGGIPIAPLFTDPDVFIETTRNLSPYESLGTMLQGAAVLCGDTVHDDHLGDIRIPVLYVGAEGGFGSDGIYTTTLLGSNDVEILNIALTADRFTDFGHDDVVRAFDAKELFWQPLRDWIRVH
jgi:hypothetical protein